MESSDTDLKIAMLKELKDRTENFSSKWKTMKKNQIGVPGIKKYVIIEIKKAVDWV